MLYQKYKKRIFSFAKFVSFVKRYKVIIISVLSAIVVTSGTLMGLTGAVVGDSGISPEIVFGEEVKFTATSFLSSIEYEYYNSETGEWSALKPDTPGEYKVRAKSVSLFGNIRYGREYSFIIKPRSVIFAVSEDEIVYGEMPTLETTGDNSLVKTDNAVCEIFEYEGLGTETVLVSPTQSNIKIYRGEEDITQYYDIDVEPKEIQINKRTVKITVDDQSKVYDGNTYSADKYTIDEGSFVDGDEVVFAYSGLIVNVGSVTTSAQLESAVNQNGDNVFNYYDIEVTDGTFTITQRPLNILTQTIETVYSGSPYVYDGYQIDEETPIVYGETIDFNKATITDVGWIYIKEKTSILITKDGGFNSTGNYKINYPEEDYIRITPYEINITSSSNTKVYDGTPITAENLEIQEGVIFDGEKYIIEDTGDIIVPTFGVSATNYSNVDVDNEFSVQIKKPLGGNSYGNYTVHLHWGKLSIEKRTIALNTKGYEWIYNANKQKDEYSYLNSDLILLDGENEYYELVSGHALKTNTYTEITNVSEGEVENVLTFLVKKGDDDLSINYDIKVLQKGILKILPAPISVETAGKSWVYDGDSHSNSIISAIGLLSNHQIYWNEDQTTLTSVCDVLYEGDNVIGKDNVFEFIIKDGDNNDQTTNYKVVENGYTYGKLVVEPRPVNITTASNSWVYNGIEYSDTTFAQVEEVSFGRGLLSEKGHQVKYDGNGTATVFDVINGKDNVFDIVIEVDGEDKTKNYAPNVMYGTLTVTVRHIKIVSNSSLENIYEDNPFTANGYDLSCLEEGQTKAIPDCDKLEMFITGTQTVVGQTDNQFTYTINRKQTNLTSAYNYDVEEVFGKIEVLPRPITIKTGSESWTYDGYAHSNTDIEATNLVVGHQIKWDGVNQTLTKITDVIRGEKNEELCVDNVFNFVINKASGEDVTVNYVVVEDGYDYGQIRIEAKEITATTGSRSWEYSGSSLYNSSVTSDGLVLDHTIRWDYNQNTITKVTDVKLDENGQVVGVDNVFGVVVLSGSKDKTHNYNITIAPGTLTITQRRIVVSTQGKTWIYEDEYLSHTEGSTANRLVSGHYTKYDGNGCTKVIDVTAGTNNVYEVLVYNADNQDVSYNYNITSYTYGKLVVEPRPVNITTASHTWVYNGVEYSDTNIAQVEEVSDGRGLLVNKGHQAKYDGNGATIVFDATEGEDNVFDIVIEVNGQDKTDNYAPNVIFGTLIVTKRHIEIFSSGSLGNVYNGLPYKALGYTLTCREEGESVAIPDCDELKVTITGERTEVGTSDNTFTYTITRKATGLSSADNYEVKEVYGIIEVIPREITVQTGTKSFVFDGTYHSYTEYNVVIEGSLVLDHEVEFDEQDKTEIRNVIRAENGDVLGTQNIYEVRIVCAEGDKTGNYDITYDYGTLTVTPIDATVTTATKSWIYDGTEHSQTTLSGRVGLLSGHWAVYDGGACTSVLNALTVKDNVFKVVIKSSEGDETNNYNISYEYGKLSVEKREITATLKSIEEVYSGKPLTCDILEFSWTNPEKTVAGQQPNIYEHEYVATTQGEQLFVGTSDNKLLSVSVTCGGQDVGDNYIITLVDGTLTVLVRPIFIKPADREKFYDGNPLISDNSYETIGIYGVAYGDTLSIVAPGEITKVGELEYYITDYVFTRDGIDVGFNYDVDYSTAGILKVNRRPITVISGSCTRVYDGTAITQHTLHGDVIFDGVNFRIECSNEIITANFTGYQIEVEDVRENNFFTVESITDKNGEDSMDNYVISLKYGTLRATPRPIVVNTGSKDFVFDGEKHFYTQAPSARAGDLVLDHVVVYDGGDKTEVRNVSRNQLNAVIGVDNVFEVRVISAQGDKTHNYSISYDYGKITIIPLRATVTTATREWQYDGEVHFDTSIVGKTGFLVGHEPYYDEKGRTEVKDVMFDALGRITGTDNKFGVKVVSEIGDETNNYDITYNYGTLKIIVVVITIKPIDMKKAYDGTPLVNKNGEFEYVGDISLPSDVVLTIETDGNFIGPGTVDYNITSYQLTQNGVSVNDKYIVNCLPGKLTVTLKLIISTGSAEKVYDGTPLTNDNYTVDGALAEGENLKVTVVGSLSFAGRMQNVCIVDIVDGNGNVVEGAIDKYEIEYRFGTLTVSKRKIFYNSPSATKEYDGEDLFNDDIVFEPFNGDSGLLPSHEISLIETTRIRFPGKEENKITRFNIVCGDEDVTSNYTMFAKVYGQLEVTGKKMTVTTASDIKTYDGEPLINSEFMFDGELMPGHELVVETNGSQTEVGESKNTAHVDVVDKNGNSVYELYIIEVVEGVLVVMPEDGVLPDGSVPSDGQGSEGGSQNNIKWYKVLSSKSGRVYLRMSSYGDYTGSGWDAGVSYGGFTTTSPIGYTYLSLLESGLAVDTITVEKMFSSAPSALPYYVDTGLINNKDDVLIKIGNSYTYNFIMMPDLNELVEILANTSIPSNYSQEEWLYRQYVYNTYLQFNKEETKTELLKVIERNNLDASDPEILLKVASLVQQQVTYSKTYHYEEDFAVYFFNEAETGICTHYTIAATMLFRALGIPARSAGGITGEVVAGEETILEGELHAWVEVYIDGIGWIQVEVTGSSDEGGPGGSGSGGNSGNNGGSGNGSGNGSGSGGSGDGSGSGSGDGSGSGSGSGSGDGSGDGSGSGSGGSGSGGSGSNSKTEEYYVKPVDVIEKFESTDKVVYAEQKIQSSTKNQLDCIAQFKKYGYTWDFKVEGKLVATQEGVDFEGESNIIYFVLYNENGDVLFSTENDPADNKVIINLEPGRIVITYREVIEMHLFVKERVYSGQEVSYSPNEYYIRSLPATISNVEFDLQGSLSTPGTLKIEDIVNENTFKAYDTNGQLLVFGVDYVVDVKGVPLTITKRSITVASASADFEYNGKEQTANSQSDATVSVGSLIDGHEMIVEITGSITDVGRKENTISTVTIYDRDGNNVTSYYDIKFSHGTLTVY